MILYLSSAINDERFANYLSEEKIKAGHQAQKFNSLIIRGLSVYSDIRSVANPPFSRECGEVAMTMDMCENVQYVCLGTNKGHMHKFSNFKEMYRYAVAFCKKEKPEAVVCDAINPLASLTGIIIARKFSIHAIAIVTDIPDFMDAGKKSLFTRVTSVLLKKYDRYVFLTEAMNSIVNIRHRPYIVMEGLCDSEILKKIKMPSKEGRPFVCVYTGSLAKGTGIEELVTAFCSIEKDRAELHIYGNGDLAEWIERIGLRYPNICYKGIVTNKEAVEAQFGADLLVNPRPAGIAYGSVSFPSKIMEYMVSGTPVLTTMLPGIPKEYFNYVYSVDDDSAEGIERVIKQLLSKDRDELRAKGMMARNFVLEDKNNITQAGRIYELARRKNEIKD